MDNSTGLGFEQYKSSALKYLPKNITLNVDGDTVVIDAFKSQTTLSNVSIPYHAINIFASGPSIAELTFDDTLIHTPSMFVNGSLNLIWQHHFTHVVGYVISDARFIKHNPEILEQHYTGQPLYATTAVFEAISKHLPHLIIQYHQKMQVIFPVDRPWGVKRNQTWLKRLSLSHKNLYKKKPLTDFARHANFIIKDDDDLAQTIGVSLDITQGFVEAGTVAYVAAQLAYSFNPQSIHLYGIDLINSNKPRFYETKDDAAPCKLHKAVTDRIVPSFDLLADEYQKRGVTVINHSPVSKDLFSKL